MIVKKLNHLPNSKTHGSLFNRFWVLGKFIKEIEDMWVGRGGISS